MCKYTRIKKKEKKEKVNVGCFLNECHVLFFLIVDSQSVTAAFV